MGIYKVKDRRGRRRYVVSKYWPNGSGRLRMYAPNYRSAQALQTRIESSILDGTWKQLKQELAGGKRTIWTVRRFYKRFFEEYCKPRLRCLRRYALSFKSLNAMLGNIPLKEFQRKDLHRYVAKRKGQVQPATVNRDIATLNKLFSYALECGEIDTHPLVRFPELKEPKKVFRLLTVHQFRNLVEAVDNPSLQAMIAVIGETGIRKGEALSLTWSRADLGRRMLWVEFPKDDESREIPLSKYAAGYLAGLVRHLNTPYVFVSRTGTRWVNPDKSLRCAAERVGLKVGFHDLRRFRCSHWLMQGVDVRTVQKLMGHSAISTTMRYAGYVSSHALQSIREAQANEDSQTQQATGRKQGEMIRGKNWDKGLKRKDLDRSSVGQSNGFPTPALAACCPWPWVMVGPKEGA